MAAGDANNNGGSTAAGGDYYPHAILKGKRTKRMRLLQVLAPRAPSSSASSSGEKSAGSTTTEEEVDTANSLIMLAERPVVTSTGVEKMAGGSAYQCKTCSKCFQSFQALGGHRASHNKPRPAPLQQRPATAEREKQTMDDEDGVQVSLASSHKINIGTLPGDGGGRSTADQHLRLPLITTTTRSDDGNNSNNGNTVTAAGGTKPRVHECAICGSEFSSGQALGGHMRRHRAPAAPKKGRSILSLDLNLPAPMDDDVERASHSLVISSSGKRPLIFLPSALVDCHH